MNTFRLKIVSPDGLHFDGDAVQLSVRGTEGELAILAGHVPYVTALVDSECRIYTEEDGQEVIKKAEIRDGVLCVTKESTRVLVSGFVWLPENKS